MQGRFPKIYYSFYNVIPRHKRDVVAILANISNCRIPTPNVKGSTYYRNTDVNDSNDYTEASTFDLSITYNDRGISEYKDISFINHFRQDPKLQPYEVDDCDTYLVLHKYGDSYMIVDDMVIEAHLSKRYNSYRKNTCISVKNLIEIDDDTDYTNVMTLPIEEATALYNDVVILNKSAGDEIRIISLADFINEFDTDPASNSTMKELIERNGL